MFNRAHFAIVGTFVLSTLSTSYSSLLQALELVGSTPAEFSVSNGLANYTIPIAVAPGRGGMQPSLSLNYSSGGGEGLLGLGWHLEGLSRIHRCGRTLVQDGQAGGVQFDANDRYCLNGQRLVPVKGVNGAVGTEYRTEVDHYSQITSVGGGVNNPDHWVVKTKAGQIMTYGGGRATHAIPQGRISWSVSKINDTTTYTQPDANAITFTYSLRHNTQYLEQIHYPGGRVDFTYLLRPNVLTHFLFGQPLKADRQLKKIDTYSDTVKIRSYQPHYEQVGTAFRLTELRSCDRFNHCLKPQRFEWESATSPSSFHTPANWINGYGKTSGGWSDPDHLRMVADVNGDGLADIVGFGRDNVSVALSNGSGFDAAKTWIQGYGKSTGWNASHPRMLSDVNGDGLLDIVGFGHEGVSVALSTGSSFTPAGLWVRAYGTAINAGEWGPENPRYLSDMNGDGLADIVGFANEGVWVSLSSGSGFQAPKNWLNKAYGYASSAGGWSVQDHPRQLSDMNGDGLLDIVGFGHGGVSVALSTGSRFKRPEQWSDAYGKAVHAGKWGSENPRYVSDMNGDGLPDIVGFANEGVLVALSSGRGFQAPKSWLNKAYGRAPNAGDWSVQDHPRQLSDMNGDGLLDIVGFGRDGVSVALSTGSGFKAPTLWSGAYGTAAYAGTWDPENPRHLSDVNGDGRPDIVGFGDVNVFVSTGLYSPNRRLAAITDNNGNTTRLSYQPLTNPSVYTKGSGAEFPVIDVQYPQYVVSKVTTSNGIGGNTRVEYRYEGLKVHALGRGSFGYASITEYYPDTQKTRVTQFDQSDFPYAGTVKTVSEHYRDQLINEKHQRYTHSLSMGTNTKQAHAVEICSLSQYCHIPLTGRAPYYRLNLAESVERSYELGDSEPFTTITTTHEEIDRYGNIGHLRVVTSGHNRLTGAAETFTKTVKSNYDNDTNYWLLGRLKATTVIHQSPYGKSEVRRSTFAYDGQTGLLQVERIIGANGTPLNTTHYRYDAYGQKIAVRLSAAGEQDRVTTTRYDVAGRPTQVCNAYNQCETYTYTAQGWRASTTGPNGLTTRTYYDSVGRVRREERADGTWSTVAHHFAESGQCGELMHTAYSCTVSQSSGTSPTIVQYDKLKRVVRSIKPGFDDRLVYSDTRYNRLAQVSRVSRDYYPGDYIYWATSQYDALDRVIRMTEPAPQGSVNTITYQYDGLSTTTVSGPEARTKTVHRNALGQKIRIEEEAGSTIAYTYSSEGNLFTTIVNDNPDTLITLSYDEFGRKIAMDDPDMGHWTYAYNGFNQLIRQRDAKGQVTTLAYDKLNRMVRRTEPEGSSTWVYGDKTAPLGSIGKLLQESGHGLTKDYRYDELGRPVSTTTTMAGEGRFTSKVSYDELGRVSRTTYPGTQGFYTQNRYNERGFLVAVQGSRRQAEAHDYRHLQPLIKEATTLAATYLERADKLKSLGHTYRHEINVYRQFLADQRDYADQCAFGGYGGYSAYGDPYGDPYGYGGSAYHDPFCDGYVESYYDTYPLFYYLDEHRDILDLILAEANLQRTDGAVTGPPSPRLLAHINNTLDELEAVQAAITALQRNYEDGAEQLVVLGEQTLAVADHNYQYVRTLDNAAEIYDTFESEASTDLITYWRAADVDASGRISAEVYGNGVVNDYAYHQGTGQLQSIHSSLLVIDAIRHLEYQYDAYQNVTKRHDLVNDINETYEYDRLDRLTATHVRSDLYSEVSDLNQTQRLRYDVLGNITYKSDMGDYRYGAAGPHAVTQVGNRHYQYDANGNMTHGDGRTLQWSSFNKPTQITQAGRSATFRYGPNRSRYKKVNHQGDTTLYLGLYEKHSKAGGDIDQKHYIYANGQLVAEHIVSTEEGTQTRYLHKDALGSVDLVTDAHGNVVDRRSFDSWGKLRNLPWQANASLDDPLYLTQLPFTNKGYTGHENIQEVGLINGTHPCVPPFGQLRLFKFVPDKLVT